MEFTCNSVSEPKWYHRGGKLPRNAWSIKPKVLSIKGVVLNNTGYYACEGTNEYGEEFYAQAKMKIRSKYNFICL